YWPLRVRRGGEVLAPAEPEAEVQVIDVRDLGDWIVRLGDAQQPGVYNAVGFDGRFTMEELLHGCKVVTGSKCSFTWVPEEFLLENKVSPYMELPLWLPSSMQGHYDVSKAIAAGLTFRPLGDTILDTLDWFDQNGDETKMRAGMKPEREVELLEMWKDEAAK
ncbi:MAG: epimerase, partial [Planctomycetota bacterium]